MSWFTECIGSLCGSSTSSNSVTSPVSALSRIDEEENKKKEGSESTSNRAEVLSTTSYRADVVSRTAIAITSVPHLTTHLSVPPQNAPSTASTASTASSARLSVHTSSPPTTSPSFAQRNLIDTPQQTIVAPSVTPAVLKPVRSPRSDSSSHGPLLPRICRSNAQYRLFTLSKSVANIDERIFFLHQEAMLNAQFNNLLSSLNNEPFNKMDATILVFNSAFTLFAASKSITDLTGFDAADIVGGYTYRILPSGSFKSDDPNVKFQAEIEYLRHQLKSSINNIFITTTNLITKANSKIKVGVATNKTVSVIDQKDLKVQMLVTSHKDYYIGLVRKITGTASSVDKDVHAVQQGLKALAIDKNSRDVEYFDTIYYSRYAYHFSPEKNAFQLAILNLRQQAVSGNNIKGFIIDKDWMIVAMSGDELEPDDVLWRKITVFLPDIEESLKSAPDEAGLPGLGSPHVNTRQLRFQKPGSLTASSPASSLHISQTSLQLGSIYYDTPFSIIVLDDFRPGSSARGSFSSASRNQLINTVYADMGVTANGSPVKRATPSSNVGGVHFPTPISSSHPSVIDGVSPASSSSMIELTNTHLSPPSKNGPSSLPPIKGVLSPPDEFQKATPRKHMPVGRRVLHSPRERGASPPLNDRWQRGIPQHLEQHSRGSAPASLGGKALEPIEDEPIQPPARSTAPPSLKIKYNEPNDKADSNDNPPK